jgi:glycosyltransferase involved in cell wall biosynthesis
MSISDDANAIRTGSKDPRIACVATHAGHSGGAAIAMERLVAGLRGHGIVVDIVSRDHCPPATPRERRLDRTIRRALRHGRTDVSNTLFTADWPSWDITGHPAVAAADFVNVHWVAGFLAAAGIRRLVERGKRVAWTLHDMRPFTGGCHYAAGCGGFAGHCMACPQLVRPLHEVAVRSLARARRRLAGLPLVFISPSQWLAGELHRSSVFDPSAHEIRVIPNGLNLDRYRPADAADARRRLGLPLDRFCILLGSVSLAEHRKGTDVAIEAVARAAAHVVARGGLPPVVVTYGSGMLAIPGVPCHSLGILDEAGVIEALQACDTYLTMAREDNLPNTVMEALSCGRPVVGTAAGGIPEMVENDVEGWLVPVDDAEAAARVLAGLAENPTQLAAAGVRARQRAEREWDARLQSRRYLALADAWPLDPVQRPVAVAQEPSGVARAERSTPAAVVVHRGGSLRGPLRHMRRLARRRMASRGRSRLPAAGEPRP